MKYESGEFVPLDYKNLRIDYAYEKNPFYDSPGDFSVDYRVPEFTYWADMNRVAEEIYEWEDRSDSIPKEYEDKEYDYIEANFEELVNKYKQKLMDYFEDEATDVLLDLYLHERNRGEATTDGENYYPPNFKPAKGKTYSYYLEGYEEAYDFENNDDIKSFSASRNESVKTFGAKAKKLNEAEHVPLYVIKDRHGNQLSAPNPDDSELWDRVESMEARGRTGLSVVVYTGKKESLDEDKGQPRSNRYRTYFNRIKRAIEIGDEETLQRTKEAIMYAPAKELKNSEASELMDMIKNRNITESVSGKYGEVKYEPRRDGMSGESAVYANYHLFSNDGKYTPYWAGEKPMGSSYNSVEDAVKGIDAFIDRQRKDGKMLYMKPINEASYGGVFDIEDDQYFTSDDFIEFSKEIIDKVEDHYEDLDPSFFLTDLYMDNDKDVLHIEIDDDDIGTFAVDQKIDYRKVKTPDQVKIYTKEILDKFIKQIDVVVKKNIQKIKRKKFLYEASYGGAYDIEDDQYFTKEELIEFADEIIEKIKDHYKELDPHFFITDLYMDKDKNVLHLEIEDDNLGTVFIDQKIDYRKVKTPYQIRNYTKEILDKFIKQIDSLKEALSPADYSPKQTGIAYKVFKVKNGKLYPPMVSNKNNEPTPVGVWLDAEEGEFAGLSKTGRPQVKSIGSGNLSYRPGWHLGDIPRAKQFDRRNKETGEMEFPKDFVWAECEYAMDVDYQPESDARGYERTHIDDKGNVITTKSDKYQHSLAGLPKLPKDGYYKYRTNPNPDTVPWIITGQMKVNKLLSDDEVNEILKSKGVEPIHRQGGDKTLKELGL